MFKGPDAFSGTTFTDFALGPGWDLSTTLIFTQYYYTGDINNLRLTDFVGTKFSLNLSYSCVGFESGIGITVSPVAGGEYIIGFTSQVGAGMLGPGGGVNWGGVSFYK